MELKYFFGDNKHYKREHTSSKLMNVKTIEEISHLLSKK
jgi:hypothetical protein